MERLTRKQRKKSVERVVPAMKGKKQVAKQIPAFRASEQFPKKRLYSLMVRRMVPKNAKQSGSLAQNAAKS